jgi:hypothetical protein
MIHSEERELAIFSLGWKQTGSILNRLAEATAMT